MAEKLFLVFDIETAGIEWDQLTPSQQEYLLRGCETEAEQEEQKQLMALSPLTAQIVCVGLALYRYDLQQREEGYEGKVEKEAVLLVDPQCSGEEQRKLQLEDGAPVIAATETQVLRLFWKTLERYAHAHLVTFNGRTFDAPFLMLRSAVLHIRPSVNLMAGTRWRYDRHTDLADELSFFGGGQTGPQRRYNFDFYAHAFGIPSPKGGEVHGYTVGEFFRQRKLLPIAEYCLRDVRATWQLFLQWNRYLNFSLL